MSEFGEEVIEMAAVLPIYAWLGERFIRMKELSGVGWSTAMSEIVRASTDVAVPSGADGAAAFNAARGRGIHLAFKRIRISGFGFGAKGRTWSAFASYWRYASKSSLVYR